MSRFDEDIDRVGTHSTKWDMMEKAYGVSPEDGLAMWVADMDFRPPDCVRAALQRMVDHGLFGYFGPDTAYRDAIRRIAGSDPGANPEGWSNWLKQHLLATSRQPAQRK